MKLKTPTFPKKSHHPAPAATPPAPATTAVPRVAPTTAQPLALRKVSAGLAAPVRQRNAAVILAGLAFIIVAGALAASVAASFDDSIEVLVASEDIAEGQPIAADDFRTVRVAAAAGDIKVVSPDSLDELVGRIAAGPIGEGALVHPSHFADPFAEERIVVGATLTSTRYPAADLKPGDTVRLIAVNPRTSFNDDGDEFSAGSEIATGEITDISVLANDRQHFSIQVSESSATVVAQLAAQDRLVLALVDQSVRVDQVTPISPADPVLPEAIIDSVDEAGDEAGE